MENSVDQNIQKFNSQNTHSPLFLKVLFTFITFLLILVLSGLVFLITGKPAPSLPPLQENSTTP